MASAFVGGWGSAELADNAILVVSELVTNALLHARTEAQLILRRLNAGLRIEVADGDLTGPTVKDYAKDACTGRGLSLVSMLAAGWGVEVLPDGKRVWVELSDDVRPAPIAIDLSAWDDLDAADPGPADAADGLIAVRLIGLPVRLQQRSSQHHDELVREFQLIRTRGPAHHVPVRLIALTDALTERFGSFTAGTEAELAAARRRGDETVDLVYRVPREVSDAVDLLGRMLDEVDVYCRAGTELLTLAAPADLVAFRRWFLDEFTRQAEGMPPRPWRPDHASSSPADND